MRAWLAMAIVAGGCSTPRTDAAPAARVPAVALAPVASGGLCVTKGVIEGADVGARDPLRIREPTVRAFALDAGGDAASLRFTYRGPSETSRALASGQIRRQVGLKLRAADGCNLVYVMWRIEPKPGIDVTVKSNPGKHTHEECGADGYTRIKPAHRVRVPALVPGEPHTLQAEIHGDELTAWVDGRVAWYGLLPEEARAIRGPAGIRTDNVQVDVEALAVPEGGPGPKCKRHDEE